MRAQKKSHWTPRLDPIDSKSSSYTKCHWVMRLGTCLDKGHEFCSITSGKTHTSYLCSGILFFIVENPPKPSLKVSPKNPCEVILFMRGFRVFELAPEVPAGRRMKKRRRKNKGKSFLMLRSFWWNWPQACDTSALYTSRLVTNTATGGKQVYNNDY